MWVKKVRETLPRHQNGVDYGTDRDVILRKGTVQVFKTRGHTSWLCVGSSGYYSPIWYLADGPLYNDTEHLIRKDKGRVDTKQWIAWLPQIAKAMRLKVKDMPRNLPQGGTLVWVES